MENGKVIFATSFISAVLVLGAMVPLGYLGLQDLTKRMHAGHAEVQKVVIELKAEALAGIKTATGQAAGGMLEDGVQPTGAVNETLQRLETGVQSLHSNQQELIREIRQQRGPVAAAIPAPTMTMEQEGNILEQTVYFPMGKIAGPLVAEQMKGITAMIAEHSGAHACVSNVSGYTDALGGDKSNLELSQKRAEHIAVLLRNRQIPVGDVMGWGERRLKIHTVDAVQHEKNRRVVISTVCEDMMSESTDVVS